MSSKHFLAAGFALGVLAFGSPSYAAPVVAGDYYEDSGSTSCNGGGCSWVFSEFPASTSGKFITITEVSCRVASDVAFVRQAELGITDNGANYRRPHMINLPYQVGAITFSQNMSFKVAGGPPRAPMVMLSLSESVPGSSLLCTLVGKITSN